MGISGQLITLFKQRNGGGLPFIFTNCSEQSCREMMEIGQGQKHGKSISEAKAKNDGDFNQAV